MSESPSGGRTDRALLALIAGAAGFLALMFALTLWGSYRLYQYLQHPAETKPRTAERRKARRTDRWSPWRGAPAPALSLKTIGGETIDLQSLRGKRVVLDFWATWCKPCREAIPDLNKLAKEWAQDAVVVGITEEDRGHVQAFLAKTRIDYHVVAGLADESLPEPFRGVDALPTLFFIDKDGTFRAVLEGYHHYDCLEARFWVGDVASHWAKGRREEALKLAERTLEVHLDPSTEDDMAGVFGTDATYAALHERVKTRVDGLVGLYERKYDRDFGRDRATVVWVIWSLGAEKKDKEAVPHLLRYLRESSIEEARWRAADALWEIGDARAVPDLVAALQDPSLKVAGFSASALGDLGDPTAAGPVLDLFLKLPDNREEAKARAADALGKIGDARAIAPLAASLEQIRDPEYVRWTRPALDRLRK